MEASPVFSDLQLWLPSARCSQEGRGNPTNVANTLLRYHVDIIVMLVNRTRGYVTAAVMQADVWPFWQTEKKTTRSFSSCWTFLFFLENIRLVFVCVVFL